MKNDIVAACTLAASGSIQKAVDRVANVSGG
jgi:hypothetical protein